ncbi:hypothetical protein EOM39_03440 [Candidatus Gracilibacteria bacterium]|nr:hypothetical protein [Candidatus Gracilibacteria bacterium]
MPVKTKNNPTSDSSTQRHLPFSQIRENVIIMKDNSGRLVLECSTINFLLKSVEEQNSIIISFQRFLNSLDFPVQILIRSKKLDIDGYIKNLNELGKNQKNQLLQEQTYEYVAYLNKLVEVAQIMKKEFYIIIPYDSEGERSVRDNSFLGVFRNFWLAINNANDIIKIRSQIRNFNNVKRGLYNRMNSIKTSLENIGIKTRELEKSELIKFLTDYYNPSLESHSNLQGEITDYNVIKE